MANAIRPAMPLCPSSHTPAAAAMRYGTGKGNAATLLPMRSANVVLRNATAAATPITVAIVVDAAATSMLHIVPDQVARSVITLAIRLKVAAFPDPPC